MRHRPSRVPLVMAWVLLGGAVATPARALPVRYTFEGTLDLDLGSDSLNLDGALLRLVAVADTSDPPATIAIGDLFDAGFYNPSSLTATFSGRPGGVPDETVAYSTQLVSVNWLGSPDAFRLDEASATLSLPVVEVRIPIFGVLLDGSLFPSSGVAPLPVFGSSDVVSIGAGMLQDAGGAGLFRYIVQNPSATVEVIPEPGTAWLLTLGLLGLARRRSVHHP